MEMRLEGRAVAEAEAAKRVHKKDAEPAAAAAAAAEKTKTMPEKINMHTLTPKNMYLETGLRFVGDLLAWPYRIECVSM